MIVYMVLTGLCWLIFIVVWLVSAVFAKRTLRNSWWMRTVYIRLIIAAVLVLVLTHTSAPGNHTVSLQNFGPLFKNLVALSSGLVLCAAGIALAIWARMYLGRNWGMPMSIKEEPELVTTGPYAHIRHPIYAGMILAIIGSILSDSVFWFIPLIVSLIYFLYSASTEEGLMATQFPTQYPAYKARTWALVPWVW